MQPLNAVKYSRPVAAMDSRLAEATRVAGFVADLRDGCSSLLPPRARRDRLPIFSKLESAQIRLQRQVVLKMGASVDGRRKPTILAVSRRALKNSKLDSRAPGALNNYGPRATNDDGDRGSGRRRRSELWWQLWHY